MSSTFIDALKIPAFFSTLRKIQCDSASSLKIFHAHRKGTPLSVHEKQALNTVMHVCLQQTTDAIIFYHLVKLSVLCGGTSLGMLTQVAISINAMTAERKQHISPMRWIMDKTGFDTVMLVNSMTDTQQEQLVCGLGKIADFTGYHAIPSEKIIRVNGTTTLQLI